MKYFLSLCLALAAFAAIAQPNIKPIDKVVAVVGNEIVLYSEVETQLAQMKQSNMPVTENTPCQVFEELLYQSLLVHQARLDSVIIGESQLDAELERRINVFVQQFGSRDKLEAYYGKSIDEIKFEFRDLIEEQLMAQQVQQGITESATITPADVRAFYNSFPKDSLPYVNSELEMAHILRKPPVSDEEDARVRGEVEEYRRRVLEDGDSFRFLASRYSEDPGSAVKGGELGFMTRDQLVPEFARVAFTLQKGQVSEVVKTEYGYHILELIAREGEMVNVRHILRVPKISTEDLIREQELLLTIRDSIVNQDSSFASMALRHSTDDETKYNGGKMVNFRTNTSRFDSEFLGQYDRDLFFALQKMEPGQVTEAMLAPQMDNSRALHIVKLLKRTEPHVANLKDDYQQIAEVALVQKQNEAVGRWIDKRLPNTYLRINEDYQTCKFQNKWNRVEAAVEN